MSTKFQRLQAYQFFGVKQSNEDSGNVVRSYGWNGGGKLKMVTSERQIRISWLVHKSDSNQILTAVPMFSGSDYQIWIVVMFYGQTGSGQFRIAASKLLFRISQLVH